MADVDVHAEVQGRLAALSADARAHVEATTGVDVTNARVAAGAVATVDLAEHGFNPNSQADQENMVAAIAGGLSLIPGGVVFGGAVEALYQLGKIAACPVMNAFAAIGIGKPCGAPPCEVKGGPWTADMVLRATGVPAFPKGSFGELVMGALAFMASKELNCEGGVPLEDVVDAVVTVWNRTHAGPAADVFVPPLRFGAVLIPRGDTRVNEQSVLDPNVRYAFRALSVVEADPTVHRGPASQWAYAPPFPFDEQAPGAISLGFQTRPPRVVSVNTGPTLKASAARPRPLNLHAVAPKSPGKPRTWVWVAAGAGTLALLAMGAALLRP